LHLQALQAPVPPNECYHRLLELANQPNVDLTINDVTGKKRIEKLAQSTQVPLDLKELEAGIYFLEVHTKTGVQIKKISKN
jgi:hypothetical protein